MQSVPVNPSLAPTPQQSGGMVRDPAAAMAGPGTEPGPLPAAAGPANPAPPFGDWSAAGQDGPPPWLPPGSTPAG